MSLYANIGDKITIFNTECTVVGISVLTYIHSYTTKNLDYNPWVNYPGNTEYVTAYTDYVVCEYRIKNNNDNSIWYLEENLSNNISLCLYKHKTITKKYFKSNEQLRNSRIIQTIGETDYVENSKILYRYYSDLKNNLVCLVRTNVDYVGFYVNIEDVKVQKINSFKEDILKYHLPIISQFHNDNVIKNTAYPIKNGFKVGDGLLINDQEYFVLTFSISTNKSNISRRTIKSNEYKLYNNNTKEYAWLKYFNNQFFVFTETDENMPQNILCEGNNVIKPKSLVDWESYNNQECDYIMYHNSFSNDYFLEEKYQHLTKYYKGFSINDSQIKVIKYQYNYKTIVGKNYNYESINRGILPIIIFLCIIPSFILLFILFNYCCYLVYSYPYLILGIVVLLIVSLVLFFKHRKKEKVQFAKDIKDEFFNI
ncbi:MAG: hypothetical protein MJ211_11355 [Bacteroidales bacterium]|nr:hypothetical protein [Bacteroidales bacterium]